MLGLTEFAIESVNDSRGRDGEDTWGPPLSPISASQTPNFDDDPIDSQVPSPPPSLLPSPAAPTHSSSSTRDILTPPPRPVPGSIDPNSTPKGAALRLRPPGPLSLLPRSHYRTDVPSVYELCTGKHPNFPDPSMYQDPATIESWLAHTETAPVPTVEHYDMLHNGNVTYRGLLSSPRDKVLAESLRMYGVRHATVFANGTFVTRSQKAELGRYLTAAKMEAEDTSVREEHSPGTLVQFRTLQLLIKNLLT